ncbi:hypothetical protein B566_EDAN018158 [Ephemera danica]|nr:hypothetical protein B566_EDAN018158 [Ephemera danica]
MRRPSQVTTLHFCFAGFAQTVTKYTSLSAPHEFEPKEFQCRYCPKSYGRKPNLLAHVDNIHGSLSDPRTCAECKRTYKNARSFHEHIKRCKELSSKK